MRIRMLATALVTTGALMGTLTGAASADGTPAPEDDAVVFACEGGGQVAVRVRTFTRAEIEKLEKEGKTPAVPALPSGTGVGGTRESHGDRAVRGWAEAGPSEVVRPEEVRPGETRAGRAEPGAWHTDVTITARPEEGGKAAGPESVRLALPEPGGTGTPGKGGRLVITGAVPVPGGKDAGATGRTETKVTLEGGEPVITCAMRK
ncbi:hypothetical protein ACLQ2R_03915 [Streptosporangium sp. DT93]|uniref:hypothetical protein n=1 Tax=Streptosporangium sp. DT93 TaxID=3393428 RepID=UPI003CED3EB9